MTFNKKIGGKCNFLKPSTAGPTDYAIRQLGHVIVRTCNIYI